MSKTEIMRRLYMSPTTLKRQAEAERMTEEKYKRLDFGMAVRDRRATEIFPTRAEQAIAGMTEPRPAQTRPHLPPTPTRTDPTKPAET